MAIDGLLRTPERPVSDMDHDLGTLPAHLRETAHEMLHSAEELLAGLDALPDVLHQLGDDGLHSAVGTMLQLRARCEQLATLVVAEASARGTVATSCAANTTQWIAAAAEAAQTPLDSRDAHCIATVAEHCADSTADDPVTSSIRRGRCSAPAARTALLQAAKVQPIIPTAERQEVLSWFLALDPSLGVRGQRQLTRRIIAEFAPDRMDRQDGVLERTESLTFSTTETGMTRLIAELAPINAAIVKDALLALSAPQPGTPDSKVSRPSSPAPENRCSGGNSGDPNDTGAIGISVRSGSSAASDMPVASDVSVARDAMARDDRTPGKRRLDALMSLIGAATRLTGSDAVRLGPIARVVVTVPLSTVQTGVGGCVTSTGDTVDAGAARRLACDADLVPAVLGSQSEPLDVGRTRRLVTGGLRTAVLLRDRGCTFPGCDRPPQFCEVHHVRPWWAGGETSLLNSATLCTTHHQTVHRHGFTATVSEADVGWDLTPGLMSHGVPAA